MSLVALSELLGATVRDAHGTVHGRVREIAVAPQDHPTRIAYLVVRTPEGDRTLRADAVKSCGPTVRTGEGTPLEPCSPSDGVLLLKRDLLNQQIIDVHGRKVVRVNDVEIESTPVNSHVVLNVVSVNVGARGAIRRLCQGVVPRRTLRALLEKIPAQDIPWQYVDLLETDPARRVKLKIAYEGLAKLHPADIADIVEDLPPAEREAVFETIDEEVAAETLEELDPDVKKSIIESLDKDRVADIVEEMDPDAAADLLGDLQAEHSGEILKEMAPEERDEVSQLLEFGEHTAAGRMTTEYIAVPDTARVDDAIEVLKRFEGGREALATIYLIGPGQTLTGSVALVRIATSPPGVRLSELSEPSASCAPDTPQDEVAALFDKYNLITLAVVDEHGRLAGIITADDVITMLDTATDGPSMKFIGKGWRNRLVMLLAVIGPGFITANVDNDAGGIFTYSQAGAQFGYVLLWTMIPITIALVVVQEMASRMGAVTGKGLSDLIREEFGFRLTFFVMLALVITNFGNVVAEFAGIASSMELFGLSRFIVVPVAAFVVWLMVVRGTYDSIEKIFLTASAFYVCYIIAGVLAHPDWKAAAFATVTRPQAAGIRNYGYVYMVIALVGTTIAPWMQFYLQASIVEKGVTARQYRASRWDVILGCIFTDVVAWFIIVACAATLYAAGHHDIADAADAAQALRPLAGQWASILFAAGLFNASLFAASILPISTAYAVCEGLGFESGLDKKFHEAPVFYWLYTLLIVLGAGVLLIPRLPLVTVLVASQVVNGILLPFVLIFMLILTNDREVMGEYINSRWFNNVAWITVVVMIVLTLALTVRPG